VSATLIHLVDGYPEFFARGSSDKVSLQVLYPQRVRWWLVLIRVLFGEVYVGIPHGACLFGRLVATGVLIFIAWWASTWGSSPTSTPASRVRNKR
jgi:hypothetical protein